jgi:hypothetical protein
MQKGMDLLVVVRVEKALYGLQCGREMVVMFVLLEVAVSGAKTPS